MESVAKFFQLLVFEHLSVSIEVHVYILLLPSSLFIKTFLMHELN